MKAVAAERPGGERRCDSESMPPETLITTSLKPFFTT
jgi:hypothetical protein